MNSNQSLIVAVATSLVVHTGVLGVIVMQWEPEKPKFELKKNNYVKAELVQLKEKTQKTKEIAAKPKVVDLAEKQKEQERLKREADAKKQRELKLKREKEKKKAEAEKKRKEAEQKKKAEQERLEAQRKKQRERERREKEAFDKALAEERALLLEESYQVEAESFMSAISRRIEGNWSRPPSARNGMKCELLIRLVPTGRVVTVEVVQSSGNVAFDRSAVQAVKKVEQFPEIKEMSPEVFERFYRELKLVFNPQDLRQ